MDFRYPYTDMHELNLDWFLAKFKELVEEWNQVESDWNSLHDYVQNYFDNLNVQSEINNKINAMIADGTFALVVTPLVQAALPTIVDGKLPAVVASQISAVVAAQIGAVVAGQLPAVAAAAAAQEVGDWLAAHIDPDTGYVIDTSLTVSSAAADAKTVGDVAASIYNIIGNKSYLFTSGYIPSTEPVDINDVHASATLVHCVIPCDEGDTFSVSGFAGSGSVFRPFMFIDSVGNRVGTVGNQGYPYINENITAPANAVYLVVCSSKSYEYSAVSNRLIKDRVRDMELTLTDGLMPYRITSGYLKSNGTVQSGGTNTLYKYKIPTGLTKIYMTGKSTLDGSDVYCSLWFVANGAMMSGENVTISTKPQFWDKFEVDVPNGAEEIWAYYRMNISVTPDIARYVESRLKQLETNPISSYFSGAYTWGTRVEGLRMLADAQGVYFAPFESLGMGVNRGNGLYGDDYVTDNIHPTALGGYNVAIGMWSYLKTIPNWFTAVPGTDPPFDGTQWAGKTWYAYGTSLTAQSTGKWVSKVASLSGMTAVNKGIGGGALVTNRLIYNALLDMDDGKLAADLITIEVGANDLGELGDPYSLDTNTFYGALNHCIHEMYAAGVKAQIVLMASYPSRYKLADPATKYDVDRLLNA